MKHSERTLSEAVNYNMQHNRAPSHQISNKLKIQTCPTSSPRVVVSSHIMKSKQSVTFFKYIIKLQFYNCSCPFCCNLGLGRKILHFINCVHVVQNVIPDFNLKSNSLQSYVTILNSHHLGVVDM